MSVGVLLCRLTELNHSTVYFARGLTVSGFFLRSNYLENTKAEVKDINDDRNKQSY